MNGASADVIRAHVARITSNELFAGAERLCRFLRFTVDCKLTGREDQIKEYVIGREVFDRGESYDPRIDPIVRVEARRLRSRLAEYYGSAGREETLRIEYPKGAYIPVVRSVQKPSNPAPSKRRAVWVAVAGGGALVAATAAFVATRPASPPVWAPVPLSWIEPNDGTLRSDDVSLAEDVDAALANRPDTRVIAWPEIVRKKSLRLLALRDLASNLGADRLLVILVRNQGQEELVRVFVIEEPSGRKRLALSYVQSASATSARQYELASRIVRDLLFRP